MLAMLPPKSRLLLTLVLVSFTFCARAADDYKLGPDSQVQEAVPKGAVTKHTFDKSKIFPGTKRDYWIYVPAQYDKENPACVMIFQDGGGFIGDKGSYRVPIVLDNLIQKKEIPVTIGVFINPGVIPAPAPFIQENAPKAHPRYNRSFEYDTPSDLYARFLLEELLPEIGKSYNLAKDGASRGICGASSGGIAAFTAAWERPAEFSRVISFIGSYTNLRGGHDYPSLIRKSEPRPIRVFLQDGSNDLDIYSGSWWIGNQDMLAALKFAGYEHQWAPGDGAHSGKHGGSVLPDALRYIWKDYPAAPKPGEFNTSAKDTRPTVMSILIPGEGWQLVSEDHRATEGPTADAEGNVFFTDVANSKIFKVDLDGKTTLFAENTNGADGMEFGPGGKLYAACSKTNEIVTFDKAGKPTVLAKDIMPNDVAVTHTGHVYVTDHKNQQVWHVAPDGAKKVVDKGLNFPNGLTLTPDQSQLLVADMRGAGIYAYQIQPDGSLANKSLYFFTHIPPTRSDSGADGLCVDTQGRLYAATHVGIQVFDQAGRVNAILSGPVPGRRPANITFGGPSHQYLYATHADKVFRRKTKAQGVLLFNAPILPPQPRL